MEISLDELAIKLANLRAITNEYYINEQEFGTIFGEENKFLFSKWDFFETGLVDTLEVFSAYILLS